MRKLIVLVVVAILCLVGYRIVSDSRHEHAVRTEEGFLRKRLCKMRAHRERVKLCETYYRQIGESSVGCYEDLDPNTDRPAIWTYIYWVDHEPGPDRPLECK